MGVHKAISTPEIMWQHFENYRKWCAENPIKVHDFVGKDGDEVYRKKQRPLTYEGFCNYLENEGIIIDPVHYFINWEGRYGDFVGICSRIKRVIREDQISGGLAGIYNPSITQRLNNLVEKTEAKDTVKVTGTILQFNRQPGNQDLNADADKGD